MMTRCNMKACFSITKWSSNVHLAYVPWTVVRTAISEAGRRIVFVVVNVEWTFSAR